MDCMSSQASKHRQSFPRGPILAVFMLLAGLAATEASAPGRFGPDARVAGVEVDAGTEGSAQVDTQRGGALAVKAGPPVPKEPDSWQKRPPCDWAGAREVVMMGACYIRAFDSPPCPPRMFEADTKCFVAVAKAPRPDTSVDE